MSEDEERIAWESAWRAMPHHRLVSAPGIAVADGVAEQFGEVVAVTVSLVPPEYSRLFSQTMGPGSVMCAVCGKATSEPMRLLAMVNVRFDRGIRYGLGAWVHRSCFETCPEAGEPPPIPY